jgi:hypothetical protein
MQKRGKAPQNKKDKGEKTYRISKKETRESSLNSRNHESADIFLRDTPFYPRMMEHVKILSDIPFKAQREEFILRLHETYGSSYVQHLMKSISVQAKLNISDPNDIYEQEADRVAEEVTRNINTQVQRQEPEEEELLQGKLLTQREIPEEEELIQDKLNIQRQEPEEEELLQGKLLVTEQPLEEEELQLEPGESYTQTVAGDVETRINSVRGSGQPLPDNVKQPMELAFGADFSGVRTHSDKEADTLNRELSAKAFTTGQDVFFRDGEYSPGSSGGQRLIAHELTHVLQQTGSKQLQRNGGDGGEQIPAEGKKKSFWSKLGAVLKAIGEAGWEVLQELVVDLVEQLSVLSVIAAFKNVVSAAAEAYEAWRRQKAYKEKASQGNIGPALMKEIRYGVLNSARYFKARVTEVLKETTLLINDFIGLIGTLTGGVVTLATKCINFCVSGVAWLGKQISRFLNWWNKGREDRSKRASVIVDAAVESGASKEDREVAVDLITNLHIATPADFIILWEEQHEVITPPKEVDEDVLDWIRRQDGETRDKIKTEITENVADTLRGVFW